MLEVALFDVFAGVELGFGEVEEHDDGSEALDGASGHDVIRDGVLVVEVLEVGMSIGVAFEDVLGEAVEIGGAHGR